MDILLNVLNYLLDVLLISVNQFLTLFAVFFFFGLLLYLFARFTRVVFVRSIGMKFDIYITGWIGTPIHELGHAIFCIIFGHKISEMKLFSPNNAEGSLGYVNHRYNPRNPWHRIGNFFIGFGPIILGSLVILLLGKYLIPNNSFLQHFSEYKTYDLTTLAGIKSQFIQLFHSSKYIVQNLFVGENLKHWQFWVFIYLAVCVSSHMQLSPPDLKGLFGGLVYIFGVFIVVNIVVGILNVSIDKPLQFINGYTNSLTGIFSIATICSSLFFASSYILLNVYTLIRYRKFFHPFA